MNLEWAETIIKELIKQGVRHFCVAYGNRSTPLVLAAAHHPLANSHVHFDERGLGFFALGLAKSLSEPVAIIVTSGTAIGNLYPAVMEASHSLVPLIILTADRPAELQHTGANQTCNQVNFFASYSRFSFDFPSPEKSFSNQFIQSTIAHLVHRSLHPLKGPVQLNCPFREPFFDPTPADHFNTPFSIQYINSKSKLNEEDLALLLEQIDLYDEGMIVVGEEQENIELQSLINLSKHLNFPVFTEIHSSLRIQNLDSIIDYPILTLRHGKKFNCEYPKILILVGSKFISKEISDLQKSSQIDCIIQISSYPFKADPEHTVHHRVIANFNDFSELACKTLQKKPFANFFQKWSLAAKKISGVIDEVIDRSEILSEPLLSLLLSNLPHQETSYFIANSMPIRYMNDFFHLHSQRSTIFSSRGLSGIDGNIATAIGLQKGLESILICMIGDMATLHDLNSFSLLSPNQKILFIICNNFGGGIFTKVANHQPKEILDKFFVGKHNFQFSQISEMFQIPYLSVDSIDAFSFGLNQFFDQKGPMILEVAISNPNGDIFYKQLENQINQAQTNSGIKSYFFN